MSGRAELIPDQAIQSFTALIDDQSTHLILGSIPGKASLTAMEYYAHPRNAFWPIISHLFDSQRSLSITYTEKIDLLKRHRLAVWDVLYRCNRTTSLDADIQDASIVVNDFVKLFKQYPTIKWVYFNGNKAAQVFNKYVKKQLLATDKRQYVKLPSTSPAHATLSFSEKLTLWGVIKKS